MAEQSVAYAIRSGEEYCLEEDNTYVWAILRLYPVLVEEEHQVKVQVNGPEVHHWCLLRRKRRAVTPETLVRKLRATAEAKGFQLLYDWTEVIPGPGRVSRRRRSVTRRKQYG